MPRLFDRIEKDFGVERGTLLALWGVETAYGDPLVQKNYMRPVFPSLAALAWNEPRRRAYWETELINALRIVERGWGTPDEMRGSWAGAMGHTQWMPEVWLNVGIDYDGDGHVSPFGKPDDALASSARYLINRGKYRRNEHWGYEVKTSGGPVSGSRSLREMGGGSASSAPTARPFPQPEATRADVDAGPGRAELPAGPELLCGAQLQSVDELCAGDRASRRPASRRRAVRAALPRQRAHADAGRAAGMQTRLTQAGFDTGGNDGRVGNQTMQAVKNFQIKAGIDAGRRLCRAEGARAVAAGILNKS